MSQFLHFKCANVLFRNCCVAVSLCVCFNVVCVRQLNAHNKLIINVQTFYAKIRSIYAERHFCG